MTRQLHYLLLENDSADGRKQYFLDEDFNIQTQIKSMQTI